MVLEALVEMEHMDGIHKQYLEILHHILLEQAVMGDLLVELTEMETLAVLVDLQFLVTLLSLAVMVVLVDQEAAMEHPVMLVQIQECILLLLQIKKDLEMLLEVVHSQVVVVVDELIHVLVNLELDLLEVLVLYFFGKILEFKYGLLCF
jgi:hypothetical protein